MANAYPADKRVWTEYRNEPSEALGSFLRGTKTNRAGRPIHTLMREAKPNELVVHFLKEGNTQSIAGCSYVKSNWQSRNFRGRSVYRIDLKEYVDFGGHRPNLTEFIKKHDREIRGEIEALRAENGPHHYPFALAEGEIRLYQKGYFSEAHPILKKALLQELSRLGIWHREVSQANVDDDFAREVEKSRALSSEDRRRRLQGVSKKPEKILRQMWVFKRNPDVVAEVSNTAAKCQHQDCKMPIPFQRNDGQPYLEVHHRIPLAQGGEDTVDNAIALCPNCHRRLHYELRAEMR